MKVLNTSQLNYKSVNFCNRRVSYGPSATVPVGGIAGVTSRDDMVCGESGSHPLVPNYRTGHWEERTQLRNEDGSINLT